MNTLRNRISSGIRLGALAVAVLCLAGAASSPAAESGECIKGSKSSPLRIEVFSDFQCPACRAFYIETMKQVFTEYGDSGKACIAYREFPLTMHKYGRKAALYGHAALKLSPTLWLQVADTLFQNQDTWAASGDIEAVLAKALAARDLEAIKKLVASPKPLETAIDADIKLGTDMEVNSTPTFFVTAAGKTEKVPGAIRFPILKRYLDTRPMQ